MPKTTKAKSPEPPPAAKPETKTPPARAARTLGASSELESALPDNPYGRTPLALFVRMWTLASKGDRNFIVKLLDTSLKQNVVNIREHAFWLAKGEFPETRWLPAQCDAGDDYGTLRKLYLMLLASPRWKSHLLETLGYWNQEGLLRSPEDVLEAVEQELSDFQEQTEDTIDFLRDHPHRVKEQIQQAIKEHPDLIVP